jgi:alpha-N-arabinofuranosidase
MQARITLDKDFIIGDVDPRLFGGFAEHLGRCIYEGLYEPGHPRADEQGFRKDVLALVRELGMPVMRYPGGNFVSGYNWEDGVGPREERPSRLDLAWQTLEPNAFGTNEFAAWCKEAQSAPIMAVNLGTQGPDEARQLVEYCNHPGGTALSDLRKKHGHADPHDIKLWCLGNEMDGPWQMGHKTAQEYGRIATEAAKLMKWTDPSIELVACGSSAPMMPTYPAWEAEVLEHAYDHVDYISIHRYYENIDGDTPRFLAEPDDMADFIETVASACDYVRAKVRKSKRMMLSFDEWNVWYHSHGVEHEHWTVAPHILEDVYTMEDALVVGGMLITLMNHCDRVKIGCLAQVVNVIAPIMTEAGGPAWRQTTFHPFAHASAHGRGTVLRQATDCPVYTTTHGREAPYLGSACVMDPETGALTVFAVNRSLNEALDLAVELKGFEAAYQVLDWAALRHDDLKAVNTKDAPNNVAPQQRGGATYEDGLLRASLPPASWNVIRLTTPR